MPQPTRPWPPTMENSQAALSPPSLQQFAQSNEIVWARDNVVEPRPWLAFNQNIGHQFRRYVSEPLINGTAGTEVPRPITVEVPCALYGLSGGAYLTTGADLGRDPLDTFRVRFGAGSGDRIDTLDAIASAMLGTGAYPALLGGPAWTFNNAGQIQIFITPILANLYIQVVLWVIEMRGPSNFNPIG